MAVAAVDTQQGATITLSVDSLTLRVTNIAALRGVLQRIRTSHLGTTTKHTFMPGDLVDYQPIPVTYQNSPGLANPTKVVQTFTITGPLASGASVAESVTGTGFVMESDDLPSYSSETEGLQMKSFTFTFDGGTGPTRTVSS